MNDYARADGDAEEEYKNDHNVSQSFSSRKYSIVGIDIEK